MKPVLMKPVPMKPVPMKTTLVPPSLTVTPTAIALPPEPVWRLTLAHYHAMVRSQILTEADPLEFLDGFLVPKMIKNPPHRLSTGLFQDFLSDFLPPHTHLNVQEPITLETSEPEPDLAVVQGKRRDYRDRHPSASEVLLVVEVADATLERDRGLKQRLYAAAGIAHYWILNLVDRQLECYAKPAIGAAAQGSNPEPAAIYQQCDILTESSQIVLPWVVEGDRDRPRVIDLL